MATKEESVKNAFENLPKEYKEKTSETYEDIFGEASWIKNIVRMRDRLNHGIGGGGDLRSFQVSYDEERDDFSVPMWTASQELGVALDNVFDSLLMTCALFCATILGLRLPDHKAILCNTNIKSGGEPICKIEDESVLAMKDRLRRMGVEVAGL